MTPGIEPGVYDSALLSIPRKPESRNLTVSGVIHRCLWTMESHRGLQGSDGKGV